MTGLLSQSITTAKSNEQIQNFHFTNNSNFNWASNKSGRFEDIGMTNGNDFIQGSTVTRFYGENDREHVSENTPLTKREYFAAMAMQGMLSDAATIADIERSIVPLNQIAVIHADALIRALNARMCPDCKLSTADGHYDEEHKICPTYERAISERETI